MVATSGTSPVCLVFLVDLVYLVGLVQPNKRDRPNKSNNGLLLLADLFSFLLDEVSAGVELVFRVVDQADNVVAEIPALIFLG